MHSRAVKTLIFKSSNNVNVTLLWSQACLLNEYCHTENFGFLVLILNEKSEKSAKRDANAARWL